MKVGIFEYMDCAHNVAAFCADVHGHTYKVEVVVEGEIKDGMVLDFKVLRETAKRAMGKYDHKNLNDFFETSTCENVCRALYRDIKKELPGLSTVRCWEGHNKWAEASAEDMDPKAAR